MLRTPHSRWHRRDRPTNNLRSRDSNRDLSKRPGTEENPIVNAIPVGVTVERTFSAASGRASILKCRVGKLWIQRRINILYCVPRDGMSDLMISGRMVPNYEICTVSLLHVLTIKAEYKIKDDENRRARLKICS